MSRAEKIAQDFTGDPKGLPQNVQDAIADVEFNSRRHNMLVDAAIARGEADEDHPRHAYRFEEVDGEIVEIRKESARAKLRIIYRPDMTPPDKVDLSQIDASNVEAFLKRTE